MTAVILGILLAVALVALVVVVWRFADYRARFVYSKDDLKKSRDEAIQQSRATVSGQVAERLTPLLPQFLERFNPRDACPLGNPIDFVVFDGLDEGELREIVFVEVKSTAKAKLDTRERQVRRCVDDRRVRHELLRLHMPVTAPPESPTDSDPSIP